MAREFQYRLRMSGEEFDRLTELSERTGKTKADIIREALNNWYDNPVFVEQRAKVLRRMEDQRKLYDIYREHDKKG